MQDIGDDECYEHHGTNDIVRAYYSIAEHVGPVLLRQKWRADLGTSRTKPAVGRYSDTRYR